MHIRYREVIAEIIYAAVFNVKMPFICLKSSGFQQYMGCRKYKPLLSAGHQQHAEPVGTVDLKANAMTAPVTEIGMRIEQAKPSCNHILLLCHTTEHANRNKGTDVLGK